MNEKVWAYLFSFVGVAACCIGVPLLIAFLGGVGLFAWITDNTLAVIGLGLIGITLILFNRDRRKRRRLGARREPAVENPAAKDSWRSTSPRRPHFPGKRS